MAAAACVTCGTRLSKPTATRCVPCFKRERAPWTRERIRHAIVTFFVRNGRPPTSLDWRTRGPNTPSRRQVAHAYGTFNEAVRAAGFTPRGTGHRGQDRHDRLRLVPTVANGFTEAEELAFLVAEQARDELSWTILHPYRRLASIDALASAFINASGLSYSDDWTWGVCRIVDRRREIDNWAEMATA